MTNSKFHDESRIGILIDFHSWVVRPWFSYGNCGGTTIAEEENLTQIAHDFLSLVISAEGKKRRLFIKTSKVADEGQYMCKTNAEETTCELIVEREYY